MGAGRGKTRRVRADKAQIVAAPTMVATIVPQPRPDYDAWIKKFVKPQDIGMIPVSEYYGVRKVVELATELIRDMEAIGSFKLPAGASMDDFNVYIAQDFINPIDPKDTRRSNTIFIRRT